MAEAQARQAIRSFLVDRETRINNAHEQFYEEVQEQFHKTRAEAEHVLSVFRKAKAVKLDAASGRFRLTHGAYWELGAINNALAIQI